MDGLLCGITFRPIAAMGHLPAHLQVFDDAAAKAGNAEGTAKAEIEESAGREQAEGRR